MESFNTFAELIKSGGFIMLPLIICSLIAWFVIFERLWIFRGLSSKLKSFHLEIGNALLRGDIQAVKNYCIKSAPIPTSKVILATLEKKTHSDPKQANFWKQSHFRERAALVIELKGRLWILATLASASPFIGLFGTVVGILKSFHEMAKSGSGGFAVVSAGISEALVATAAGLLIAIVSLLAYNSFQTQLTHILAQIKTELDEILEIWNSENGTSG